VYANGGQIIIYADLAWDAANSNTAALGTSSTGIIRLQGNIQHHYGTSGLYGMSLVTGRVLMANADNTYTYYAKDNGSGAATGDPAIHYGASLHTGSMPAAADVRYPVTYGPGGAYTGTCRVPAAASVAYGVPVDNTTGTAVLTPTAVANAVLDELLSDHNIAGSTGSALLKINRINFDTSDRVIANAEIIQNKEGYILTQLATGITNEDINDNTLFIGDEIDNTVTRYTYLVVEVVWVYSDAPVANRTIELQIFENNNDTGYENVGRVISAWSPPGDTLQHSTVLLRTYPLLPNKFKLAVRNVDTNQTISVTVNAWAYDLPVGE
jgi:hypothetical protein